MTVGDRVDARRVEAAAEVLFWAAPWEIEGYQPPRYPKGNKSATELATHVLVAADEAVGGVVPREAADKLAEVAEECLRHGNSRTRAKAQRALAAYRRATGVEP